MSNGSSPSSVILTRICPDDYLTPNGILHAPQILGHGVLIPRTLSVHGLRDRTDACVIVLRRERVHGARIDLRGLDEPRLEFPQVDIPPLQRRAHDLLPGGGVHVRLADVLEEEPYLLPRDLTGRIRVDELEESLTSPAGGDVPVPAFLLQLSDYRGHHGRFAKAGVDEFGPRLLGNIIPALLLLLLLLSLLLLLLALLGRRAAGGDVRTRGGGRRYAARYYV